MVKDQDRQPVSMPATAMQVGGWLRGIRFSGFSLVMLGLLVLAVFVLAPSLHTYAAQRQQITHLRDTVTAAQANVAHLKAERERWNDNTYVITQARDRLSYVLPGDISFLVINDLPKTGPAASEVPVSKNIQEDNRVDWMQSMLASVMTAGLAPEVAPQ